MTDTAVAADYDSIILDGMPFKILGRMNVQQLSTFQRRITIGDSTKDSHDLLSSWVVSDLTGGHGLDEHRAGTTEGRYRFGTLDVRRPSLWALAQGVTTVGPASGGPWAIKQPLGDLGGTFYVVFGNDIYSWDEDTGALTDTTANVTDTPVGSAVAFTGTGTPHLFIPLAAGNGFDRFDGTTVTNETDFDAVAFAVFGRTLVGIDDDGQLYYTTDGNTWTSYGDEGKLDEAYAPRGLIVYRDATDAPALYVITDRQVWVFDPAGPTMYLTDLHFPPHEDQGLASAVWRGTLYVSVGMGMHSYNGSTIAAMGLDRDHGISENPTTFPDGALQGLEGRIVALCPEYNGLYALVNGEDVDSLHVWTGFGWHCVWVGSAAEATGSKLVLSTADGGYRLWWGGTGPTASLRTMPLPVAFTNPKVLSDREDGTFATSGYLTSGFTDFGMAGYTKIINSIEVDTDLNGGSVTVYYRYDDEDWDQFVSAADVSGPYNRFVFDEGLPCQRFEWGLYVAGAATDTSPIIRSVTTSFMKVQRGNFSWYATIDLTAPYVHSPQEMRDKIDDLITGHEIVTMKHQGQEYRVRVASWGGGEMAGAGDHRASLTVHILEVPIRF